ncbi:MAG: alpha/beta hydrolase [Clostridia bacterium]|nr:alpha/beta hydrolase [Clostridia bacterium]
MKIAIIVLLCLGIPALLVLLGAYLCFRMVFFVSDKDRQREREHFEQFVTPDGEAYDPYRDQMVHWMKEIRAMPCEEVSVTSFDGLTLRGKYYEYAPGATVELMFHGYRGSADRDLCGGAQRCFALGRSALIVDQRCSNHSEGNVTTFGIHEHLDCLTWVRYMVQHFGPDVRIILTGISMGAATVLMAAGKELPDNVIGVLADCGFTSAKEIIQKVMRQLHLPDKLLYPLVRLGARLFGHFDPDEYSPVEAVRHCKVPVIFFHGADDDYVPCEMSVKNYTACAAKKKLVLIPGADHGLSYLAAPNQYLNALIDFFGLSDSGAARTVPHSSERL